MNSPRGMLGGRYEYEGVPMECRYCHTRRDGMNEHGYCHSRSHSQGQICSHDWVETPEQTSPAVGQWSPFVVGLPPQTEERQPILPEDSSERKAMPIYSGVIRYFPRALAYIARISKFGNDKHNPGQPLHWAKDKSNDHADCCARHLVDLGTTDSEGYRHSGYLAWRALANLEEELEAEEKQNANSNSSH